jgi:hypothetical protein
LSQRSTSPSVIATPSAGIRTAFTVPPYDSRDPDWLASRRSPNGNTGAIDVVLEPGSPDVIYAALWQTRRTPWNIYPPSNGPGSGLYRSRDGGAHWTHLAGNGFADRPGRIGIAVAASDPSRVYAMVDADSGGLYRSDDRGEHWTRASSDNRIWQRGCTSAASRSNR